MQKSLFEIPQLNEAPKPPLQQCSVSRSTFYTVSNVYNFETGAEISGGNVYGNSKELGIYRAMSGSLNVWDTSQLSAQ